MPNHEDDIRNEFSEPASVLSGGKLLDAVLRHKSLVLLGVVACCVLGVLNFMRQVPQFQSGTQLHVIKRQNSPLPINEDSRGYYYDDYLATHQILIKSPLVVSRIAKNPRVKDLRSFGGSSNPAAAILGGLTVSREGGKDSTSAINILNLGYVGSDPDDCQLVLELVIWAYKDFLAETYTTYNNETVQGITKVTASLSETLAKKEKGYAEWRDKNMPAIVRTNSKGQSIHEEWMQQIQNQKLALLMRRAEAEGRLGAIESAKASGLGRQELLIQLNAKSKLAPNAEAHSNDSLFELELKEQLLLADFGPDHPEIKAVRKRKSLISEYFRGIAGSSNQNLDPVDVHLQTLKREIADIELSIKSLQGLMKGQEFEAILFARVLNEEKIHRESIAETRAMFNPLIMQLDKIKLTQDLGGFDTQVISDPGRGGQIAPNLTRSLMLAGFMGLITGVGLAFLAESMDRSFRTPDEIRRRLGYSVIGHIPFLAVDEAAVAAAQENGAIDPRLYTLHQSKSHQSEAFRGLRTALYFSTKGEMHKVIQVTSPQASDGKSTLIANLAISIAQSGRKVLLIDADLRKPRIHKIFALTNQSGLASIIVGEAEPKDAVQSTAVPGLFVIPSGQRPANPAELLTSETFKDFINTIREQYDYVLIDTPPLLAVSDPSVVAPRVDGVILAIRVTKNGRPNAERAREVLQSLSANVLGVVVNGIDNEGGNYGYGGYGSRYSYGYRYLYNYAYKYGNYGYTYNYANYSGYYDDDEARGSLETAATDTSQSPVIDESNGKTSIGPPKRKRPQSASGPLSQQGPRKKGFLSRFLGLGG